MAARHSIARFAATAAPSARLASSIPARFPVSVSVSAACRLPALARTYSSAAADDDTPPPLLVKLKGDLKAAMKAKDAARLSVLRSVMAATLNASKTAQPINTDAKLVELLRKTARSAQEAVAEFRTAGRADLAEKEEAQIRILEAYAQESGIESVSKEDLEAAVAAVLEQLATETGAKPRAGDAIKRLLAPGGPLDGKDFNKAEMALVVKRLTS